MGRSTWLNGVKAGKYPAPIFLSPRRPVWKQSSIDALIASL
jgi:predicted DNA-binding transcriptional regulator AlpA